jgi:hypothetical protein
MYVFKPISNNLWILVFYPLIIIRENRDLRVLYLGLEMGRAGSGLARGLSLARIALVYYGYYHNLPLKPPFSP